MARGETFLVLVVAAAILFVVAAFIDFTNGAHVLGFACIGLAVLAIALLLDGRRATV
jgi:hypothetical protein